MLSRLEIIGMLAALASKSERVTQRWGENTLAESVRELDAYTREVRSMLKEEGLKPCAKSN